MGRRRRHHARQRSQALAWRAAALLAIGAAVITGALMALSAPQHRFDNLPLRFPIPRLLASVNDAGQIEPLGMVIPPDASRPPSWPPSLLNPEARLRWGWDLSLGRPSSREVLFTFDDGPNPGTTDRLLPMLARANIHAAFFVCGWRLESSEEPLRTRARQILRDTLAAGHVIGNHTVHHLQLPTLSPERVRYEIEHNADLIEEVIGQRPHLFRPPYGAYSEDVRRHLVSRGNELWMWSIDPHDYLLVNDAESVAQRVITNLGNHAGGTVLLHDTHPWSVAAMPKIIRWLEHENADRELAGRAPYVVLDPAHYMEGARARLPQIQAADALLNGNNPARHRDAGPDATAVEPTTGVMGEGPVDAGVVMDASAPRAPIDAGRRD
jgi:peptidoglycan/xylan/chitin deacetylase (PgdA/CDA1 family)